MHNPLTVNLQREIFPIDVKCGTIEFPALFFPFPFQERGKVPSCCRRIDIQNKQTVPIPGCKLKNFSCVLSVNFNQYLPSSLVLHWITGSKNRRFQRLVQIRASHLAVEAKAWLYPVVILVAERLHHTIRDGIPVQDRVSPSSWCFSYVQNPGRLRVVFVNQRECKMLRNEPSERVGRFNIPLRERGIAATSLKRRSRLIQVSVYTCSTCLSITRELFSFRIVAAIVGRMARTKVALNELMNRR